MSFIQSCPGRKRFVKSDQVQNVETNLDSCVGKEILGIEVRKTYEQIVGADIRLPGVGNIEREGEERCVRADSSSDNPEHTSGYDVTSDHEKKIDEYGNNSLSDLNKPSLNSLMKHAEQSNVHVLKKALKQDPQLVSSVDQFGWSLLMVAACAGSDRVVEFLLRSGADTGHRDRRGHSCISLAQKKGHLKTVEIIQKFRSSDLASKPPTLKVQKPIVTKKTTESQRCSSCSLNYDKSDHKKHLTSTVHQLSTCSEECRTFYSIPGSNRGYQLMLKEGWDGQTGLGPSGDGIKLPPKTILKRDRKGLGASKGPARITHFRSHDPAAVTGSRHSNIRSQKKDTKYHLRHQIQNDKLLERSLRRELS